MPTSRSVSSSAERRQHRRQPVHHGHGDPVQADLAVAKSLAAPASPVAGDTLVYVMTWTNQGPSDLSSVEALDSLPGGVTFVDATNGGTESGGVVTWADFALANGASRTDTVRVSVAATGTYTNVARVGNISPDPDGSDDRSTTATVVGPKADLGVTKMLASPASPVAGDTLVYVITTSNAGPSATSDVALVDSLPAGVDLRRAPPTAGSETAACRDVVDVQPDERRQPRGHRACGGAAGRHPAQRRSGELFGCGSHGDQRHHQRRPPRWGPRRT